jgi:2-succinyl-5-enolpyruvyl-6-hydroxy-3-cyclohexene-1-carboxylate synthase
VLLEYLEAHRDREQLVVDDLPRWGDHRGTASGMLRADPARAAEELAGRLSGTASGGASGWTRRWRDAEERARRALDAETGGAPFEGEVLRAVAAGLEDGDLLFAGSSMPVRDLDAFGAPRDAEIRVVGNRGASGIDGSVSTALGAAAASGRPGVAVLGDLALYHDMNGLLVAGREGLDVVLVVIHNDGGGIFHFLPVRDREPDFTRFFATPHGRDFRHAARMYGLEFREPGPGHDDRVAWLASTLREARDAGGPWLLQLPSRREENRARRSEVVRAAARAAAEE